MSYRGWWLAAGFWHRGDCLVETTPRPSAADRADSWMLRTATYAVLAISLALPLQPACAQGENSDLHIGLLLDSAPREADSGSDLDFLREEIHKVLGAGRSVHFLPEHLRFGAGRADYLSLANDPAVDLIIAVGPASASMLAALGDLPKPTIAVGILDVELQGMPLAEPGVSGVPNFTYVLVTHPIEEDLEAFHRIHPFSHLAVIVGETLKDRPDFEGFFQRLAAPYGAEAELVFWGAENPLPILSDSVDAVYVTMVFERRPEEVERLAAALAGRKLPSFAMSRFYVDAGIMACMGDRNGRDQIVRSLALIVEGVALGEELAAMPVQGNLDDQWVLNAATVRKIGLDLSFETLFSARFLKADEPAADRRLSLREVIAEGLRSNLDLRIERSNVDLAAQDMRQARSSLLPTVETLGHPGADRPGTRFRPAAGAHRKRDRYRAAGAVLPSRPWPTWRSSGTSPRPPAIGPTWWPSTWC